MAVRKYLEVAIGMCGQDIQQLRVHERLTAEDAEVAVAVQLGVVDDAVHIVQRDHFARGGYVDPAALATKLATVENRDK